MRVLICDDNPDAASSLEMLVASDRHETCVCADGASCVEKARSWQPGIALLDIGMPGMTGYEVAREIRAMQFGKDVLLVAITGWGTAQDVATAKEAGFDMHFTKPADPRKILSVVRGRDAA